MQLFFSSSLAIQKTEFFNFIKRAEVGNARRKQRLSQQDFDSQGAQRQFVFVVIVVFCLAPRKQNQCNRAV